MDSALLNSESMHYDIMKGMMEFKNAGISSVKTEMPFVMITEW